MKMRLFTLAVCLFSCVAALHADDPVGRYTLIAGTFTTSTGEDRKVILKMDTTTGQTWIYQSLSLDAGPKMNAVVQGWGLVNTNADAAWQDLLKKFPNAKLTESSRP